MRLGLRGLTTLFHTMIKLDQSTEAKQLRSGEIHQKVGKMSKVQFCITYQILRMIQRWPREECLHETNHQTSEQPCVKGALMFSKELSYQNTNLS